MFNNGLVLKILSVAKHNSHRAPHYLTIISAIIVVHILLHVGVASRYSFNALLVKTDNPKFLNWHGK